MYKYIITKFFSEKYFKLQCKALEIHIPHLELIDLSEDVDGSSIAEYRTDKGTIKVINDYPIGAMWVESDIDIDPYFTKKEK